MRRTRKWCRSVCRGALRTPLPTGPSIGCRVGRSNGSGFLFASLSSVSSSYWTNRCTRLTTPGRTCSSRCSPDLAKDGRGVILVTHDLHMAERYGQRMLILRDGELVHDGPPDGSIYAHM